MCTDANRRRRAIAACKAPPQRPNHGLPSSLCILSPAHPPFSRSITGRLLWPSSCLGCCPLFGAAETRLHPPLSAQDVTLCRLRHLTAPLLHCWSRRLRELERRDASLCEAARALARYTAAAASAHAVAFTAPPAPSDAVTAAGADEASSGEVEGAGTGADAMPLSQPAGATASTVQGNAAGQHAVPVWANTRDRRGGGREGGAMTC